MKRLENAINYFTNQRVMTCSVKELVEEADITAQVFAIQSCNSNLSVD